MGVQHWGGCRIFTTRCENPTASPMLYTHIYTYYSKAHQFLRNQISLRYLGGACTFCKLLPLPEALLCEGALMEGGELFSMVVPDLLACSRSCIRALMASKRGCTELDAAAPSA